MKFVLIAFSLFVLCCACDNPRGCPAVIGVGNNPDEMQLRKEGRDDQSAQMAKLPAPQSNSGTPEPVGDKLDFDKVK